MRKGSFGLGLVGCKLALLQDQLVIRKPRKHVALFYGVADIGQKFVDRQPLDLRLDENFLLRRDQAVDENAVDNFMPLRPDRDDRGREICLGCFSRFLSGDRGEGDEGKGGCDKCDPVHREETCSSDLTIAEA